MGDKKYIFGGRFACIQEQDRSPQPRAAVPARRFVASLPRTSCVVLWGPTQSFRGVASSLSGGHPGPAFSPPGPARMSQALPRRCLSISCSGVRGLLWGSVVPGSRLSPASLCGRCEPARTEGHQAGDAGTRSDRRADWMLPSHPAVGAKPLRLGTSS